MSVSFAAPLGVVLGGTDAPTCADGVCSLQLSLGEGVAERQLAFTLTQANSASMSLPLNVTSADAAVQSAPTLLVWQVSVAAWSDMFDDPSTLSLWAELEPGRHDRLEISGGQLVLEPVARQQEHWYADNRGAFVARRLHGDFLVEARVQAVQRHAPLLSPTAEYNGAGLLVRVPSAGVGNEQWLSFNTGMQQVSGGGPGFGRETKITTPGQPSSHSVRYLNAGPAIETLRLCRIGAELRVLYWNGSAWREELRSGATFVVSTGPAPLATGSPLRFDASAWGDDVDVGLMAGNFFDSNDTTVPFAMPAGGEFQTRGLFDYVRFRDIVGVADCAAP
ncbi:MAG: hypothetical protein IT381_23665 [Deltaproteobacteria bacterium]|nr:hypothetical protein [Deltaproteobacteria bacterium]